MSIAGGVNFARALFNPRKRIRDLSSSVVNHDRFDDGVLTDFEQRATHFRRVIEQAPEVVPTVRMPRPEQFEDEDAFNEAMDEALAAQERADEAAESYAGWSHDVRDIFRAYHTWDEPTVKDQQEIKPSRELGRQVMQRLTMADAFSDARPHTRHSDVEAAMATMVFSDRLREELETTLAEHVQKSQEASDQESDIDRAERALDNLRNEAKQQYADQGQVDPNLAQQIMDAVTSKRAAQQALQQTAQDIQSLGTAEIAQAVEAAAEEADEAAEAIANLPGTEPGQEQRIDPEKAFELAEKWRSNPILRKIAELLGRMKRDFRYERAHMVVGGREEVVDFEMGNDLTRMLSTELLRMKSDAPGAKLDWMRRFAEGSLFQFEMVGTDEAGRGPAILALDGSGSMTLDFGGATRNEWARALALSMLSAIHAEHRDVALVEYGYGQGQVRTWFFPAKKPIDPEVVADFASHLYGGGTDSTLALNAANEVIAGAGPFKHADFILFSDGEDSWHDDDREVIASMKAKGVRLQGIAIHSMITPYLAEVCDHVHHVLDLAHGRETAKSVSRHMTA